MPEFFVSETARDMKNRQFAAASIIRVRHAEKTSHPGVYLFFSFFSVSSMMS